MPYVDCAMHSVVVAPLGLSSPLDKFLWIVARLGVPLVNSHRNGGSTWGVHVVLPPLASEAYDRTGPAALIPCDSVVPSDHWATVRETHPPIPCIVVYSHFLLALV